jgi:hypothetical protein
MANIFAILTALVLVISGFLAYANRGREGEEKRGYRGWITQRENEEVLLKQNEDRLAAVKQELAETEGELADFNSKNEGLQTEVDAQLAKNKALGEEVDDKKQVAESKEAEVQQKEENFVPIEDVEEVIAQLEKTQASLRALGLSIDEKEAATINLEAQKKSTETTIAGLKEKISWRVTGTSNPELQTTVRSVFSGLGFVTLAGGDNLGIVKDSQLTVLRDDEEIAKLIVTTVELTTSAADIDPESLADGVKVQAGDTVVAKHEKEAPAAN